MVCRTNTATRVVMGLIRTESWLDDGQIQNILHRLTHEYSSGMEHNAFDLTTAREQVTQRMVSDVETSPHIGPNRRDTLRRTLPAARDAVSTLEPGRIWALTRLRAAVHAHQAALESRLAEIAGRRGMSIREARGEYEVLRRELRGGRTRRTTTEERDLLAGVPTDATTREVIFEMESRPPLHPPVRLVQRWIPIDAPPNQAPTQGAAVITHVGTSEMARRVEFRHGDGTTSAVETSVLTGSAGMAAGLQRSRTASPSEVEQLRAASQPIARVEETAYAVRCDHCGQFVGAVSHECPVLGPVELMPGAPRPVGGHWVTAPPAEALQQRLGEVPALQASTRVAIGGEAEVWGVVTFRRGPDALVSTDPATAVGLDGTRTGRVPAVDIDDSNLSASTRPELTCDACRSSSCAHVGQARSLLRQHLTGALGTVEPAERAAALAQHRVEVADRDRPTVTPTEGSARSFVAEPEAFRQAIQDAATGEERRVELTSDLAGYAADTRFGVEIEFSGAGFHAARRLHETGIIDSPHHTSYHSSRRSGYSRWVLESDGSVADGGELVTSVLSDQPETWSTLSTACEAIRDAGGETDHAGSHTNISAENYTPEMAWRLVRLFRGHEDDMLRLGRTRGSARYLSYTRSNPDPGPRWNDIGVAARAQGIRESMINFYGLLAPNPRIEFRFPDASLDAGVIQAQVKLCAAMTNYVRSNDVDDLPHTPQGTAWRAGWARNLMVASEGEFALRTEPIRSLIDTLFDRDQDRVQLAQLWGRGSYYRT